MLIYIFLTSGLFLGWSLGANDAANIFGTAVGSRMVSFKKAAIIASIFVVLGSVLQGHGATKTLSALGTVDAIGGAFTIALCAALIVTLMTKYKLPVSSGQAIVGGIIGWSFFTSTRVDYVVLTKILSSWISGPILGAIFSALLYMAMRRFIRHTRIHLLKLETIIRLMLIVAGAFGAYSLGANNIANVMGVFVNTVQFEIQIGGMLINSTEVLFLIGSLAIAVGIFTYSKKVMETVGGGILSMTPESAVVVVLSQAIVLFIFSSSTLSNALQSIGLPAIPLVPVSSTQVVVGAVLGIGFVKGAQELKFNVVGKIMLGWILTPILSGILTFVSLFFVQEVFGINASNKEKLTNAWSSNQITNNQINIDINSTNILILILIALLIITIITAIYAVNYHKKNTNNQLTNEDEKYVEYQKALSEIEVNTVQLENTKLVSRLEEKRKELVTFSINLSEQKSQTELLFDQIQLAYKTDDLHEKNAILKDIVFSLKQKMTFGSELEKIYSEAEQLHAGFVETLKRDYPQLSKLDKRLLMLLRIGLSSKEMSTLLNISSKSVDISRYRLRKKLGINKETNLADFAKNLS